MPHPDYILPLSKKHEMPEIETVYPMTAGLRAKPMRRAIEAGLKKLPDLPEWIDETLLAERGWPSFTAAMHALHHPAGLAELDPMPRCASVWPMMSCWPISWPWPVARLWQAR